jgi:hypothetical protein
MILIANITKIVETVKILIASFAALVSIWA